MAAIGQRLARAERAIWGDFDPDFIPRPGSFGPPQKWFEARLAVQRLRVAECMAVFAVTHDDALAIERHFQSCPALRRARNFLDHAKAVLAIRGRAGRKEAAQ
jgi:hypothetical protein